MNSPENARKKQTGPKDLAVFERIEYLDSLRTAQRLSLSEIAKYSGVSTQTVSNWFKLKFKHLPDETVKKIESIIRLLEGRQHPAEIKVRISNATGLALLNIIYHQRLDPKAVNLIGTSFGVNDLLGKLNGENSDRSMSVNQFANICAYLEVNTDLIPLPDNVAVEDIDLAFMQQNTNIVNFQSNSSSLATRKRYCLSSSFAELAKSQSVMTYEVRDIDQIEVSGINPGDILIIQADAEFKPDRSGLAMGTTLDLVSGNPYRIGNSDSFKNDYDAMSIIGLERSFINNENI